MYVFALTLPVLDSGGPLGVGVNLSVFPGVIVVAAGVVDGDSLTPVVVKCISISLICLFCVYT